MSPSGSADVPAHSEVDWLAGRAWKELCWLSELPRFQGLVQGVLEAPAQWRKLLEREDPHEYKLPGVWRQRLDEFQFLLVLRVLRPNKLPQALKSFVGNLLGDTLETHTKPSIRQLRTESRVPVLLLLQDYAFPATEVAQLAQAKGKTLRELVIKQDGRDQVVEQLLAASKTGDWVLIQNIFLSPSFLPQLHAAIQQATAAPHPAFRLWLTTKDTPAVPHELILRSLKLAVDPATTLPAVLGAVLRESEVREFFESGDEASRQLTARVLLLYAVMVLRTKYVPRGWLRRYPFSEPDLLFSLKVLHKWQASANRDIQMLRYFLGEIIFGGAISEDQDRACSNAIANKLISLEGPVPFSPPLGSFEEFQSFCASLPEEDPMELLGLGGSVGAREAEQLTQRVLDATALILDASSTEQISIQKVRELRARLPAPLKKDLDTSGSFLTLAVTEEAQSYDELVARMDTDLEQILKKSESGEQLTGHFQAVAQAVQRGNTPSAWLPYGQNYSKLQDFEERIQAAMSYIAGWLERGCSLAEPVTLGHFIFPKRIVESLALEHALAQNTSFLKVHVELEASAEPAPESLLVEGLLVEGGEFKDGAMATSEHSVTTMPVVRLKPGQAPWAKGFKFPIFASSARMPEGRYRWACLVAEVEIPSSEGDERWEQEKTAILVRE